MQPSTFTVGPAAIQEFNNEIGTDFFLEPTTTDIPDQVFNVQVPVTGATQNSNAIVRISPSSVVSLDVDELLTFNLNIAGGKNVAGYQATVWYDSTALYPVDVSNGDYLPADTFFDIHGYYDITITATTLAGASNGDGTLATLTFEGT